jgi:hypothetical protein
LNLYLTRYDPFEVENLFCEGDLARRKNRAIATCTKYYYPKNTKYTQDSVRSYRYS